MTVTLEQFGGIGDGVFNNSGAFAKVFFTLKRNGGGTLKITEGVWLTGPLDLSSDTVIDISEKAEIRFIDDYNYYCPVFTRWEGVECFAMHPQIYANGEKNITITGKGTLNGCGEKWWSLAHAKRNDQMEPVLPVEKMFASLNPDYKKQPGGGGGRESQFLRPSMIEFTNCFNVVIQGVKIINSPFWTIHPLYTNDITLKDLHIENPYEAPNTDGIDIDSCKDVNIINCYVSVGDDGICLKSGSGSDGVRCNVSTDNVFIKDCTVRYAHGGIVLGSETAAGIHNVVAQDCDLDSTDRGIRIKSRRGRAGKLSGIHLKNIKMNNTLCPIAINMYYSCGEYDPKSSLFSLEPQKITDTTPTIKDVTIENVTAKNCRASAGFIAALPECPIEDLVIKDCDFSTDESAAESPMVSDMFFGLPEVKQKSFRIVNGKNARFENVTVSGPEEPFIYY